MTNEHKLRILVSRLQIFYPKVSREELYSMVLSLPNHRQEDLNGQVFMRLIGKRQREIKKRSHRELAQDYIRRSG